MRAAAARAAEGAGVALLVALVCVPVWPGVFTVDSQAIYRDAIEGRISTWYAPTLGWIWGVADGLGMPPSGALVAGVTALVLALLATYRLWFGPAGALLATAATVLWPPLYGMLGWVGRDVWFVALVLTVVALLGWAARLPERRAVLAAAAAVPAWLAFDARQNGFPVLAVWGGTVAWWLLEGRRWWPAGVIVTAVAAVGLGAGVSLAANAAIGVRRMYPEQQTYYADLLAVSQTVGALQLPRTLYPAQDLDAVRRLEHLEDGFLGADPIVVFQPYERDGAVTARIASAWWSMVRSRPLAYAEAKLRLWGRQLAIGPPARSVYYAVSDELGWYGSDRFRQAFPALNARRLALLDAVDGRPGTGGPLHAPWVYLLLGLAGSCALLLVPGPWRVVGAATLALQLTLQVGIALLAPVIQYRYQLHQVVLGIVLAVGAVRVRTS